MKYKLKRSIVIDKDTIFEQSPDVSDRHKDAFQCLIGLTSDSFGFFEYYIDNQDLNIKDWFEPIE